MSRHGPDGRHTGRSGFSGPRCQSDEGAALMETALVAPVFLAVLFGIFEYGLIYRDSLMTSDAVSDAARSGGIVGNNILDTPFQGETADWFIVSTLRQATAGIKRTSIEQIVVFQPNQDNPTQTSAVDLVPAACKSASSSLPANNCNVYPVDDAFGAIEAGDVEYFQCNSSGDPACGYDPVSTTLRNSNPGGGQSRDRYVGIYVRVDHEMVTGLFGSRVDIQEASIALIEPYDDETT